MHDRIHHHPRANSTPRPLEGCRLCAAIRNGSPLRGLVKTFWRQDGSSFAAEYSSYPQYEGERSVGAVVVFRDVTEAHRAAEQLAHQASHDALTGLVNRQEFERRLERVISHIAQEGGEYALCYLDLDQFKVVNDRCGHAAGDELLRQLGALLQEKMRARDTLARLGGDEFGVLLEHCPPSQAVRIAHDLCEAVREYRFVWEDQAFAIGVSIGVVEITAATDTLASALRAADAACYAAKEKGRNRVQVYRASDAELNARSAQPRWVARLTEALDANRFELCYQSIAPLGARAPDRPHYEILLRLVDEDGRHVEPSAFIPAAERHDLMPAIDRWVLRHALAGIAARHRQTPVQAWPIHAINLSAASWSDPSLPALIGQLLAEYDVPGGALCIEIAELAAGAHLAQAVHFAHELKKLGCLLTLDDFGGSVRSFAQLKSLPIDFLKIDGSLVLGMAQDRVIRAIAEAINSVAHVMAIQTVAECAENDEVLPLLRELGVDHAQGYAIMRPQPFARPLNSGASSVGLVHTFASALLFLFLSGCSLIGNQLGKAVDDAVDEDEYQYQYTIEGLEADIDIAKALLSRDQDDSLLQELTCNDPSPRKVCSAVDGCWCE